jgi:hypothetical protein
MAEWRATAVQMMRLTYVCQLYIIESEFDAKLELIARRMHSLNTDSSN